MTSIADLLPALMLVVAVERFAITGKHSPLTRVDGPSAATAPRLLLDALPVSRGLNGATLSAA